MAATIVIDNSSASFTKTGIWSSSVSGTTSFVGVDHLLATAPPPSAFVDNSSASYTGSWSSSTALPRYFGADYAKAPAAYNRPVHLPEFVVDNETYMKGFGTLHGASSWPAFTSAPGYYGKNYIAYVPGQGLGLKTWYRFDIRPFANWSVSQTMTLQAHWPASPNNASNATIRLLKWGNMSVVATYTVNQKVSSGTWFTLGTHTFDGATYAIEFDATGANGQVVADAIRVVSQDASPPNVAKWPLPNVAGVHDVYARWPSSPQNDHFVGWTVTGGDGTDFPANINQRQGNGQWQKLGAVDLSGSQANHVLLEQFGGNTGGTLSADAVLYVPRNTLPTATWSIPSTSTADVYVNWSADSTRSAAAQYSVKTYIPGAGCASQIQTVVVDQRVAPPGTGRHLGRFSSDLSCAPWSVTLMPDGGGGTLSADAIYLVE